MVSKCTNRPGIFHYFCGMGKRIFFIVSLLSTVAFSQDFDLASAQKYQADLSRFYATDPKSPLMENDKPDFKGLVFFPVDQKFIVSARFRRTADEKPFKMKTTTDRLPNYQKYGELCFSIEGKELKLNVYQNLDLLKNGYDKLFLPFFDLTSGNESYIGGRYIELDIPSGDIAIIDFNRAYNPYCAYNYKYSCPIVPMENDLPVEIRAGVKKFHD